MLCKFCLKLKKKKKHLEGHPLCVLAKGGFSSDTTQEGHSSEAFSKGRSREHCPMSPQSPSCQSSDLLGQRPRGFPPLSQLLPSSVKQAEKQASPHRITMRAREDKGQKVLGTQSALNR